MSSTGQSAAAAPKHDAATLPELENPGILQKEIALFRKEQAESCEVHLLLVGFHLREVGVDREVPRQATRDAVFHVEAHICVGADVHARGLAGAPEHVRFQADVVAGPDPLQTRERPRQRDPLQIVDAWQGRPEAVFVSAPDPPLEIHAPGLLIGAAEAQRPEWNHDLRVPPRLRDPRLHVPQRVPVLVDFPPLVDRLRVPLRAVRVRREHIAVPLVVERVQDDLEIVAGVTVEVLRQFAGEDVEGFAIVCEHPEVKVGGVVQHAHLGIFRGGLSFAGIALYETARRRRAGPIRFIECAVDPDRTGGTNGGQPTLEASGLMVDLAGFAPERPHRTGTEKKRRGWKNANAEHGVDPAHDITGGRSSRRTVRSVPPASNSRAPQ